MTKIKLRIATWNINSVRARIPLIRKFSKKYAPDILCLQEIKCTADQFPLKELYKLGYQAIEINGQKSYHGVATLSRIPVQAIETRDFDGTGNARHLAVLLDIPEANESPVILHNFYLPAGGDEADIETNPKFRDKMTYLGAMERWLKKMKGKKKNRMILVGDLNIAPLEHDVWSHKKLLKVVSHTPLEVDHFNCVQKAHQWVDVMRAEIPPDQKLYTWWSYRAGDWRQSNRGRRLDHIWVTPALQKSFQTMKVIDEARGWTRPSDHAPVIADFIIDKGAQS